MPAANRVCNDWADAIQLPQPASLWRPRTRRLRVSLPPRGSARTAPDERARQVSVSGHREYNPGWHTALDLRNQLTVSEAITRAALERRESRGGHFRDDYPAKDPAYADFNLVVRRDADGAMTVERRPIPPMPDELRQIIAEME